MKILLVNDYIEKIAGTEIYIHALKDELEKKGHIVKFFGSNISKKGYIESLRDKSIVTYLKRIFNIRTYFDFKKTLSKFKPDIIHIHNIYNELSPSILLAINSVPIIMTVHDNRLINAVSILSARTGNECKKRTCPGCLNCVGLVGTIYEILKRSIHRVLFSKINLYITPSQYMSNFIKEAGYGPVLVVKNGIHLLSPSKIKYFNHLLYVGRLTKEKGIEYLIKEMPKVIQKLPDVELKIIGDGKDSDSFIKLVNKLNLHNNIKFEGSISSTKVQEYYNWSSILIVPSIYSDNFPTVCMEAISVGRPIIVSNRGGLPELVLQNMNGIILDSTNIDVLSNAIIKLLSSKEKITNMGEKSQNISSQYSIEKNSQQLQSIYINLMNHEKK